MSSQKQQEDFIKFIMISGLFVFPIGFILMFLNMCSRWTDGQPISENLCHPIIMGILGLVVLVFILDICLCKKYYGWFEWLSFSKKNKK